MKFQCRIEKVHPTFELKAMFFSPPPSKSIVSMLTTNLMHYGTSIQYKETWNVSSCIHCSLTESLRIVPSATWARDSPMNGISHVWIMFCAYSDYLLQFKNVSCGFRGQVFFKCLCHENCQGILTRIWLFEKKCTRLPYNNNLRL